MKKFLLPAALVLAAMATSVSAATISVGTHVNPYAYSDRNTAFDQNIESESAAVTKSGSYFNYNVDGGATAWGSGTWLLNSGAPADFVEMAFSVLADTLYVQFQADSNDGVAEFIVDGTSVGTLNTFNRGWVQVEISGLSLAAHTLRVNRLTAEFRPPLSLMR